MASKLEAIREYFMDCPLLKDGLLSIDYLGDAVVSYAIISTPNAEPYIKRFVDSSTGGIKQYPFNFMSIEAYSEEVCDQIESSGFYEALEEWIAEQNRKGNLPNIKGINWIEVQNPAFLFDADEKTAKYQINMRVVYTEQ